MGNDAPKCIRPDFTNIPSNISQKVNEELIMNIMHCMANNNDPYNTSPLWNALDTIRKKYHNFPPIREDVKKYYNQKYTNFITQNINETITDKKERITKWINNVMKDNKLEVIKTDITDEDGDIYSFESQSRNLDEDPSSSQSMRKLVDEAPLDYQLFSTLFQYINAINNLVVIHVHGLGCHQYLKPPEKWATSSCHSVEAKYKKYPNDTECCNSMVNDIFGDIVKAKIYKPKDKTDFVLFILKQVLQHLPKKYVILTGHSYGGSVVNRVANIIERENPQFLKRISFITIGSIYLPPRPNPAVKITNIVNRHDVIKHLTSANLDKQSDLDARNIILMREDTTKPEMMDMESKWSEHNKYDINTALREHVNNIIIKELL